MSPWQHQVIAEVTRRGIHCRVTLARALGWNEERAHQVLTQCFVHGWIEDTGERRSGRPCYRLGGAIAVCDWCGLIDHHTVAGECPHCAAKVHTYERQPAIERRQPEATPMPHVTADQVLAALARHVGAEHGIGIAQLAREATRGPASPGAERQVREAIVELRRRGHHVCAHPSTGYHLAATDEELVRTCEYLHRRAMCSLEQVSAMRGVSLPDLRGQLRLPT